MFHPLPTELYPEIMAFLPLCDNAEFKNVHTLESYHSAAEHGYVDYLIKHSANCTDFEHVMLIAIQHGQLRVIQQMINWDVFPNAACMQTAEQYGQIAVINYLENRGSYGTYMPFREAIKYGQIKIIQPLVEKYRSKPNIIRNTWTYAAQFGQFAIIQLLIELKLPLYKYAISSAVQYKHMDIILELLKYGADVEIGFKAACLMGNYQLMQTLVDMGAKDFGDAMSWARDDDVRAFISKSSFKLYP